MTVEFFINKIGRKNMANILGLGETAICNMVKRKKIPAKWYKIIKVETESLGIDCPDELFNFKNPQKDMQDAL